MPILMQSLIVLHHSWVQQDMVTKKLLGSMIALIESHGVVFEIQWIFSSVTFKEFFHVQKLSFTGT